MSILAESNLFDRVCSAYGRLAAATGEHYCFPPLRVFLEPTYRCNCRCPFCYVEDHRSSNELSTAQWLGVIEQIPRWSFISFEGGEVTLRSDFFTLLKAAHKRVFGKVNVLTNGTVIDGVQLGQLVDIAPLVVSVSLDGLEATHDNLRGPGKFARVWHTLERLVALRRLRWPHLPQLDVKLVLLPENLADIPALYEKCARLGVDYFSISLRNDHHLKQNAHLRDSLGAEFLAQSYPIDPYLDFDAFKECWRKFHELRVRYPLQVRWAPKMLESQQVSSRYGNCKVLGADALGNGEARATFPGRNSNQECSADCGGGGVSWVGSESEREYEMVCALLQSGATPVASLYKPCRFPWASLFINPQGDVYPCLAVRIGNVCEQSLAAICRGERARAFRSKLNEMGVFNACQLCCEASLR